MTRICPACGARRPIEAHSRSCVLARKRSKKWGRKQVSWKRGKPRHTVRARLTKKQIRRFVSLKIRYLVTREGVPQKRAVAMAYSYARSLRRALRRGVSKRELRRIKGPMFLGVSR